MIILAWCESTCPDFCQLVDDFYQCNCSKYPGFQPSNYGTTCSRMNQIVSFDQFLVFFFFFLLKNVVLKIMVMVVPNNVNVISVIVIPMEQMLIIAAFVADIKHQLVADV